MRKFTRFIAAAVILIAGAACTGIQLETETPTPTIDVTVIAAATASAEIVETPTVQPTETSLPTPEYISGQVQAVVTAQGVYMRYGPGTLFQPRKLLDQHTRLTVLGRARGDDWLLVETGGDEGWISENFTELENDVPISVLPVNNPSDVITIRGQVTDSFGGPVEGISFAVMQNSTQGVLRTDATTRKDGFFYGYLPADASGAWRVALTGIDCESPIMNDNCEFSGQFIPTWKDIDLPITGLVTFQYISQ